MTYCKTLSGRKQTAKRMLVNDTWRNNRTFDNCFEMNDGDKVAEYLLDYIANAPATEPDIKGPVDLNSQQWKSYRKADKHYHDARKLKAALISGGFTWFIGKLEVA